MALFLVAVVDCGKGFKNHQFSKPLIGPAGPPKYCTPGFVIHGFLTDRTSSKLGRVGGPGNLGASSVDRKTTGPKSRGRKGSGPWIAAFKILSPRTPGRVSDSTAQLLGVSLGPVSGGFWVPSLLGPIRASPDCLR